MYVIIYFVPIVILYLQFLKNKEMCNLCSRFLLNFYSIEVHSANLSGPKIFIVNFPLKLAERAL